jgi:hypothetical protein
MGETLDGYRYLDHRPREIDGILNRHNRPVDGIANTTEFLIDLLFSWRVTRCVERPSLESFIVSIDNSADYIPLPDPTGAWIVGVACWCHTARNSDIEKSTESRIYIVARKQEGQRDATGRWRSVTVVGDVPIKDRLKIPMKRSRNGLHTVARNDRWDKVVNETSDMPSDGGTFWTKKAPARGRHHDSVT